MPILAVPGATEAAQRELPGLEQTLGKDDFLRLLVTQLANQDPLEPMDDQQFVAQMAQFSQLEQLTNMNESIVASLDQNLMTTQAITNTLSTNLIGRSVRVETSSTVLGESGSTDITLDLASGASDVVVEISDPQGSLVRVLRLDGAPAGPNTMEWDGRATSGDRVPPGRYTLAVRAEDGDGNPIEARSYFNGTVDGVRYVDGSAILTVGNALIPLQNVLEVMAVDEE